MFIHNSGHYWKNINILAKFFWTYSAGTVVSGNVHLDSFIIGVTALSFNFASGLHNYCSFSGLLFFAHLGGIIFIVQYIN